MSLKMPAWSIDRVTQLTPQLLRAWGTEAVLLDVDNTLSAPESQVPFPGVVQWARQLQRSFRLVIVSNNVRRRVAPFAAQLGLPYISFALKPLPMGYLRALHRLQVSPQKALVVGDQVYTDIIGANLLGIPSVLVTPRVEEETASFLRRRRAEEKIRRALVESGHHICPKE